MSEQNKITIKVVRKGVLASLPKQMHPGDAGLILLQTRER